MKPDITTSQVNTEDETVRNQLVAYLAPYEVHALFLLGNLQNRFKPAFTYVAKENNQIVGICAYYPIFQSCTIFATSPEAAKTFAKIVLREHPTVTALLGMSKMVAPAYAEFIASGRMPKKSPEADFFELTIKNFIPFVLPNVLIRPITDSDVATVARLHRLIHHAPLEDPITEEERARVRASTISFCVEVDGNIVSVATSNGLALRAFQILGVATDPAYQRRGYAKAVCSHLIEFMREKGAEKAIIFTGNENAPARKCYLDLGFQITDKYSVALFKPAV